MGETIIVEDSEESEDVEDAIEDVEDAVEDIADAVEDAVMDSTTIQLVERVTRVEDALATLGAVIEGITGQLEELNWKVNMAQEDANRANETVAEVAEDTAEVIEDVTEDVVEATPEITEDEVPTTREHPFFRKWGKK